MAPLLATDGIGMSRNGVAVTSTLLDPTETILPERLVISPWDNVS